MSQTHASSASGPLPMQLKWSQVLAWRVHQHHLDRLAPATELLPLASQLCGLHAQVISSAELTLWARMDGLERDAVQRALWQDRTLVKAWAMRGTLHLFASSEYPMWQAAVSPFVRRYLRPSWLTWMGVTADEFEQLVATIGEVLDGQILTRAELAEQVGKHTGSPELGEKIVLSSWGSVLKPPTYIGNLCFAPSAGQNVRFTRPSSWLRSWRPMDPNTALLEVGRRFLHTYGPTSVRELVLWSSMSAARATRLLKELADELTTVDVEGTPLVMLSSDVPEIRAARPSRVVRLLPAFDQYVVGAPRTNEHVLRPDLKARVYRNQGWFTPVLLVDGRMCGVWRGDRKSSRLNVQIEAFDELAPWVRRKAEAEAQRLAEFLGGILELTWTGQ